MIWYVAFLTMRIVVMLFFLLTSVYSLLNYSPFVFNQFIRPRIFGWVNDFVAWHHLWYCAAYLTSVVTLLPELRRRPGQARWPAARTLAVAYVIVFGLVGEWLLVTPYLPKLWNDGRSLAAALWSFLPIAWLALVDHVAVKPLHTLNEHRQAVTGQRRLLWASLATAEYLWVTHMLTAMLRASADASALGWVVTSLWALTLNLAAAMIVYSVASLAGAIARATAAPRAVEFAIVACLLAGAISGGLLGVIFPSIAFGERAPVVVALVAGVTLAAAWSGLALRRARIRDTASLSGIDLLVGPFVPSTALAPSGVALCVLPFLAGGALASIERTDWNFLVQKVAVLVEGALAFVFLLNVCRRLTDERWSWMRAAIPPVAVAAVLTGFAWTSRYLPAWTGDPRMEAEVSLDRYAGADVWFRLLFDGLVQHPGRDAQFYQYLQVNTSVSNAVHLTPPDVRFSHNLTRSNRPIHTFLFVVDSMRRDYLSPFNPNVTFTPNIARFAGESFAFQNAFSHYGGTALAVPSIWAGGLVIHRLSMPEFNRSNALEKLLDVDNYRWFMSLDPHMGPLLDPHPDLVQLDRERSVMQFDLCRSLGELEEHITARTDSRPIFAFTLPQNLHISNRQHGPVPPGESYPGFFEPYAAEVHRLDGCFGEFVSYLKKHDLFDDSFIVLTTDHGDSLGESGNWGHGVTLYPEVVRIPLIIHIPERFKPEVTTDLARLTFSTDIVPTLYELAGHPTDNLGPLFGSPLFVPRGAELLPRRRESFLLVSSYAATYGLLRRNGRTQYISDLVNGREYAYDLTTQPIGARVRVTDDIRRVNQRFMRDQIADLAALYSYAPLP